MTDRAFWEDKYRNQETGWDRGDFSPALTAWLKQVQPCRILIPGCGRGHEVLELARRGFAVTAIDIAAPAVKHLQAELDSKELTATLIHADLFELTLEPFDAIYEQTCLCAMPPVQWPDYEGWLYAHLKSGGKLLAQFMQTDAEAGPPFHCEIAEMEKLFSPSRWQWAESEDAIVPHPAGHSEVSWQLQKRH